MICSLLEIQLINSEHMTVDRHLMVLISLWRRNSRLVRTSFERSKNSPCCWCRHLLTPLNLREEDTPWCCSLVEVNKRPTWVLKHKWWWIWKSEMKFSSVLNYSFTRSMNDAKCQLKTISDFKLKSPDVSEVSHSSWNLRGLHWGSSGLIHQIQCGENVLLGWLWLETKNHFQASKQFLQIFLSIQSAKSNTNGT